MTTVEINGLKDMIACNTRISSIIDDHLSYSGYDISEFMDNKASFEEVIYLLWTMKTEPHPPHRQPRRRRFRRW